MQHLKGALLRELRRFCSILVKATRIFKIQPLIFFRMKLFVEHPKENFSNEKQTVNQFLASSPQGTERSWKTLAFF